MHTLMVERASSPINLERVQQALLIHHLSQSSPYYEMDTTNNRKNSHDILKRTSTKNENCNNCHDEIQSARIIRRNKLIDVVEMLEAQLNQLEFEEDNLHDHLFQKESNTHGCQSCHVSEEESQKELGQHWSDEYDHPPRKNVDAINPILSPGKVDSLLKYNECIRKRFYGCSIQSFERYVSIRILCVRNNTQ